MNIQEDYVSFETAKLLKEKGFDVPCTWLYSKKGEKHYASDYHSPWPNSELAADEWSCCTQAVAMKWLREVHKLYINVCPSVEGYYWTEKWHSYVESLKKRYPFGKFIDTFNSPEDACEAGIKYCLENLLTPSTVSEQ